jgi:hypothetical protein
MFPIIAKIGHTVYHDSKNKIALTHIWIATGHCLK